MSKKVLPSQELLQAMFAYDEATGKLRRKPLDASYFTVADPRGPEWMAKLYNIKSAGREAFTSADPRGYFHGKILGTLYQAHRVIWKLVHGVDPDTIDHINGNPSDNRLSNLRACTVAENSRNYAKPKGSSQYRGVCWVKRDQAWAARISDGASGKISLGNFQDEETAARAYDKAARDLHGEFAVLNFKEGL